MLNALRPFLAALLMIPLLSLAGYATAHGIEITDTQVHKAVDYTLEFAFPVLAGLSVIVRRAIDKKTNPGNAASSHLATALKSESLAIKEGEKAAKREAIVQTDPIEEIEIPPRHFRPPVE